MGWRDALRLTRRAAGVQAVAPAPRQTFSSITIPPELLEAMAPAGIAPRISRSEALQVPAVLRARNLISTPGSLPHRVHGPDRRVVPDATYLLGGQIDPDVPNSVTLAVTYADLLFESVSFWRVTQLGWHGFPTRAQHVPLDAVTVQPDGPLLPSDYDPENPRWPEHGRVYIDGVYVPDDQVIRFDSPNPPLLIHGARAIRSALMLDKAAALFAFGVPPLGYFSAPEGADLPDKDEVQEIIDDWQTSRQRNAWGYVGGLQLHQLGYNPEQLQMADARQHAVLEIARATGIDPTDLGVSVTTRTYQNSEQRRQDLIDFTLAPYVSAVEDRLSMNDTLPRGYTAHVDWAAFLRGDTLTRMQTYEVGLRVGAFTVEEIRELEDKPALTPAELARIRPAAQPQTQPQEEAVTETEAERPAERTFSAGPAVQFDTPEVAAAFRVNAEKRTITGLAVPWGVAARSGGYGWRFAKGSLSWTDPARVKLLRDHDARQAVGRATALKATDAGLEATFSVARGEEGDRVLSLAEDGVLDGLSVGVDFTDEDGWQADPTDRAVRLVRNAALREITITAMPAFEDARVTTVTAEREEPDMSDTKVKETAEAPDLTAFTAGIAEAVEKAVTAGFARIGVDPEDPQNIREVVRAGRPTPGVQVVREAPVYRLDGSGPSFVRDAWKAKQEHGPAADDAVARLRKYSEQSADFAQRAAELKFVESTTSDPQIIPPGYRPDLYVGQLPQGRPLVDTVSRGTLTDATPFTVPRFVSATNATSDHTEGTNPTPGSITFEPVTVTPGAISGLMEVTRELVDSSNPQIDAIALQAMRESYSQQCEAKVYAELNGPNGQGGTITNGFSGAGAQVFTSAGAGLELLTTVRQALAVYPFRRFAAPTLAHLSQEATSEYAGAVGADGRPLLPSIGATNTAGLGNAVQQGWSVDGLANVPTWSMLGNGAGDADVLGYNRSDVWAWESALLTFRYEERNGPAQIDLALFGYFATRLLRPVGLFAVRHTAGS
ncbi:phage portal protein [Jiangella asiatica]|uniref:phage portal protein n=1 Tax=Jiangella asiatica TaxID=2530372 RepID=UPI0013A5D0B4|nr:phage portal protein [Jiangella asiatica]